MIHRLSVILSERLCEKDCTEEDRNIYIYGIEILLSSVINIALCVSISLLCGRILDAFIFLIIFCSLRMYVGGYHANSHFECCGMFLFSYGLYLILRNIEVLNVGVLLLSIVASIYLVRGLPTIPTEYTLDIDILLSMQRKTKIIISMIYIFCFLYVLIYKQLFFAGISAFYALIYVALFKKLGELKYGGEINGKKIKKSY